MRDVPLRATGGDPGRRERPAEELAEEQTALAEKRTALSRERTFASWVRTAIAFMAAGIGIAELLDARESRGPATAFGVVLVLTSGAVFGTAFLRFCRECLRPEVPGNRLRTMALPAALLLGIGVSVALALYLLLRP